MRHLTGNRHQTLHPLLSGPVRPPGGQGRGRAPGLAWTLPGNTPKTRPAAASSPGRQEIRPRPGVSCATFSGSLPEPRPSSAPAPPALTWCGIATPNWPKALRSSAPSRPSPPGSWSWASGWPAGGRSPGPPDLRVPWSCTSRARPGNWGSCLAPGRSCPGCRGWSCCTISPYYTCCGFGGTFSLQHPGLSRDIGEAYLAAVTATGAAGLVSLDYSCLLHLQGLGVAAGPGPEVLSPGGDPGHERMTAPKD